MKINNSLIIKKLSFFLLLLLGCLAFNIYFIRRGLLVTYLWQFVAGSIAGLLITAFGIYKIFINPSPFSIKDLKKYRDFSTYWTQAILLFVPTLGFIVFLRKTGPDPDTSLYSFFSPLIMGVTILTLLVTSKYTESDLEELQEYKGQYLKGSPFETLLRIIKPVLVWLLIFFSLLLIFAPLRIVPEEPLTIIGLLLLLGIPSVISYFITNKLLKETFISYDGLKKLIKLPLSNKIVLTISIILGLILTIVFDFNSAMGLLLIVMTNYVLSICVEKIKNRARKK